MKKKIILLTFMVFCFFFTMSNLKADDIRGYMIPEYYSVISSNSSEFQGQNGFWFRRIYLGYNSDLGGGWSVKVRLEMDSAAYEKDLVFPYIKNIHIKKKIGRGANLLIGLIEPPSFNKVEKFWGFRYIEKTPADFFKFASSRDTGIAINGKTEKGIVYTAMFGNYGSNKGEWNKGKAVYGRLGYEAKSFYTEVNGYHASDGNKKRSYLSFFGGLKGSWGRGGLVYNYLFERSGSVESRNNGIISGFAVINISNKTQVFARYDMLKDLNFNNIGGFVPSLASEYKARYIMTGINLRVNGMIQFSPNFRYMFYSGDNAPKGDIYITLTAKVSFKSKFNK